MATDQPTESGHPEFTPHEGHAELDDIWTEVECEVEGCTYSNRPIYGVAWAYHYMNAHPERTTVTESKGLVIP